MKHLLSFSLVLSLLSACSTTKNNAVTTTPAPPVPHTQREFRAAWIATVANINWPSQPGLSTDEQKKEAIALLDFLQQHNFNTAVLQVRPQADALYKSELEPWSYFLTGKQGQAPNPYYDPLEFWVEESHNRGIELHVWLNPYRAHHKDGKEITEHSIVKKRPELALFLKEGYWWLDPAHQGTQDHSAAVVMDLVKRYDIDGIHFDDYFYPYPSYNGTADFPDTVSWRTYQESGGKMTKGDWRRNAVNVFIERLHKEIKKEKPYVKFGLSPFGIWRPGYPESVVGFDQYDQLYADAKLWLNKGWIDYFSPQLYWPINRQGLSFPVLLGWWASENTMKRHLWPGISVGRDTSARTVTETMNQIMISRGILPESMGVVHWSISSVTKNPNMAKGLIDGPYKKQALVPASEWMDDKAPASPAATAVLTTDKENVKIEWTHPLPGDVFHWVVYYKYGSSWNYTIMNRNDRTLTIKSYPGKDPVKDRITEVVVTAVDRVGNESQRAVVRL